MFNINSKQMEIIKAMPSMFYKDEQERHDVQFTIEKYPLFRLDGEHDEEVISCCVMMYKTFGNRIFADLATATQAYDKLRHEVLECTKNYKILNRKFRELTGKDALYDE